MTETKVYLTKMLRLQTMTLKNTYLITLALVFFTPISMSQVYRCKGQSGIEIQQIPCAGPGEKLDVRPASGQTPLIVEVPRRELTPGLKINSRPKSQVEVNVEFMQEERIRREGWFEMNNKKAYLAQQITQCTNEQMRIGNERAYSNNNLAGATRDVSITTEMKAAASICDTKTRSAEREVDQAVSYCEKIKCIAHNF